MPNSDIAATMIRPMTELSTLIIHQNAPQAETLLIPLMRDTAMNTTASLRDLGYP
jgi:hypothetical protein